MKAHFATVAALLMFLGQSVCAAPAPQLGAGARVDEVDPNGAAARAGIRPGDVIRAIGKTPINGYADIDPALTAGGGRNRPLIVDVYRDGQDLRLNVTPQMDPAGQRMTLGIAQLGEAPVGERRWALINWMMERNNTPESVWHPPIQTPGQATPAPAQQEGPHDLWHIFMGPDK
jgi:membrane-associated protease RseP (regulator of RpoE activity)